MFAIVGVRASLGQEYLISLQLCLPAADDVFSRIFPDIQFKFIYGQLVSESSATIVNLICSFANSQLSEV